jgi:hypothetical protein
MPSHPPGVESRLEHYNDGIDAGHILVLSIVVNSALTDTFRSVLRALVGTFANEAHVHSAEYNLIYRNQ